MLALTPIGNNLKDYWNNLIIGESGSTLSQGLMPKILRLDLVEVKNFDPSFVLDRKESRKLDLFSQYGFSRGR